MHHDLRWVCGLVGLVSLGPVVADGVTENGSIHVESGGRNRPIDLRVALETVLRILVPEMERAIRTCCAERSVNRVE
jgi:hypothetical protein